LGKTQKGEVQVSPKDLGGNGGGGPRGGRQKTGAWVTVVKLAG